MAQINVKQIKSGIGRPEKQRATLRGLGLSKLNQERVLADTPEIRGMLNKVSHLVSWQVFGIRRRFGNGGCDAMRGEDLFLTRGGGLAVLHFIV